MSAACLCLLVSAAAMADPPKSLPLFADTDWYKKATGAEIAFEGTVELNPATGQIGKPTRFNTYRLTWTTPAGTAKFLELYAPGKAAFLGLYRGTRVRVFGKAVDTSADGKVYHELWPARLELAGLHSADLRQGILARCGWQPSGAKQRDASFRVITNGAELAKQCGYVGVEVDRRATQDLAKELRVAAIDWKKQMLVCVAGGLHIDGEQVRITRVTLKDKVLTVFYRLERPKDTSAGIAYPAETVLVDRFDGTVKPATEKIP